MDSFVEDRAIIYDLHSHTTASDGRLTPAELVRRAVSKSVDVLAITDHDTTAGIFEALQTIISDQLSLLLIAGVEISTLWLGCEIHLLGLNIELDFIPLQRMLKEQRLRRRERISLLAQYLTQQNIPGMWPDIIDCYPPPISLTRQHLAQLMVNRGICKESRSAFRKYLGNKNLLDIVAVDWPTLPEVVAVVRASGGQAVLAHPDKYGLSQKQLGELLADFSSAGGEAVEFPDRWQIPISSNLLVSQGSDFHYPGGSRELGRLPPLPPGVTPIWRDWPTLSGKIGDLEADALGSLSGAGLATSRPRLQ